ncbi:MAG: hypothetical protein CVV49_01280 [Spirochaetae bacterium HGW-Spirochaetae-5]|nr:MAG: hypothetical protein CVV49_01280 [Spirochaetae bacterium HGW-Spirochaetae-5]
MKKTLTAFLLLISVTFSSRVTLSAEETVIKQQSPEVITQYNETDINKNSAENLQSPVEFREVWGYLMRGEEKVFKGDEPVTDVCYFSCGINSEGRININVTPPILPELNGRKRKIHMVIADLQNTSMMRFILNPEKDARALLVNDIIEVSKKFDGVQIDFEAISPDDAGNFLEFLKLIKAGLEPGKTLSVALPAKPRKVKDAYDYKAVSDIVDRVFIMAYDQHWSTSKPGPVASLSWGINVISYAITEIPAEKLIMGIPLYGRAWRDIKIVKKIHPKKKHAANVKKGKKCRTITTTKYVTKSRSVKTGNITKLISGKNSTKEYSPETGYKIKYSDSSKEILYCDDVNATIEKFIYYRKFVDSIGFWRLGMESPEMWKEIIIKYN